MAYRRVDPSLTRSALIEDDTSQRHPAAFDKGPQLNLTDGHDGALLSAGRPDSIDDTSSDDGAGLASGRADLAPEMDGRLTLSASADHDAALGRAMLQDDLMPAVACACPMCSGGFIAVKTPESLAQPDFFLNAEERGGTDPGTGKVSKTIEEAALQLNRTYASWNDFWIQPGVADVNNHWDDPYWGGAPSVVTYAFRSVGLGAGGTDGADGTTGFSRFSELQINATILALAAWSDVANIIFVRVGTGTSGEDAYSDSATMLFANYADGAEGAAAFAYYPSQSPSGGDVWVNDNYANPTAGNYAMLALIHEIGHAIGFSHPGDYNAEEGVSITYAADAEYYEDSHQYTVMSYFTENYTGGNFGPRYPATIMLDDIAAAQRTYGVNTTTRTGDTTYGFNSNADRPWFIASSASTILVFAVWDAGGTDTFDFSGYSNNQVINLNQGAFSSVGTYGSGSNLLGNVAVAMGAVIENAIGGTGADTITGNSVANVLTGNGGADILSAGGGADRLIGGLGDDSLTGGAAADVFVASVNGGADTVTDFVVGTDQIDISAFGAYESIVQSGGDTLITLASGVTFRLTGVSAGAVTDASFIGLAASPPPVFNLITGTAAANVINGTAAHDHILGLAGADTLSGAAGDDRLEGGDDNDRLSGDAGADVLFGGAGADYLDGGTGADQMTGGAGSDVYRVDDAGDVIVELSGEGTDGVYVSISYALGDNLETLVLTGAGAINGVGNALANTITGNGAANVLTGGAGADTLSGAAGDDRLEGGDDNDWLAGDAGADVLFGGAGADTLDGGTGADQMTGGAGSDIYRVDDVGDVVVEHSGEGTDGVHASISYALGDNLETLVLTGAGAINGVGNALANTITGNAAANVLTGGAGDDTLRGAAGGDTFAFSQASVGMSTLGQSHDIDAIVDLSFGDGDRIDLSAIDANVSLAGDQGFTFVGAFTGVAGQATLVYSAPTNKTMLLLDVDGDGVSDYELRLTGNHASTSSDISAGVGDGGWVL